MWRKRNPFSFNFSDYLSDPASSEISFEEWIKRNEYEDTDRCDRCDAWKGELVICPECKL